MKTIDLTGQKVLALRDVEKVRTAGATELLVAERCVITPSARDFLQQHDIALRTGNGHSAQVGARVPSSSDSIAHKLPMPDAKLFHSAEAEKIKTEICAVGKKLWARQYVDGNGGNISYRIGPNAVICTPTLMSKGDLTPEDLCMVDLDGNQIGGTRPRTSEIFLHLEIYKAVPEAKSVVHCHPPHATAYAITGTVPPTRVVPEYEVFVGTVAIAPYETPGTPAFAQTVLPFVKHHNTVLLANHGIVCWADTVTHAEWYAEVVDTYCWTLMVASQIGAPLTYIPEAKTCELLSIKRRLGLPDARFDTGGMKECQLSDLEMPRKVAVVSSGCSVPQATATELDVEAMVKSITDAVMAALDEK
ncbi:MAG TPA: class II aldolase/adducin family protein [Clostridia bacterium]|nr:class II aldolase/adducin family protein [Clostridia bacterium]